jgi:uridine kinase
MLITISGHSGSGKTEIGKALTRRIPLARFISFDDHEDKVVFPASYPAAMPEEYGLSKLLKFLKKAKTTASGPIVFDYPFGRAHMAMSGIIDFAVFLRVPIDISMARRTRRELNSGKPSVPTWLLSELENWDKGARDFCLKWEKLVSKTCDLVVDALAAPESIVDGIIRDLKLLR